MLPTEDAAEVGRLLAERFGLPFWQVAAIATDANRYVLRWARGITGREKILIFHGCYHGSVDDTFVRPKDGRPIARPGPVEMVGIAAGIGEELDHQRHADPQGSRAAQRFAPAWFADKLPAIVSCHCRLPGRSPTC
jgi:glutamate-1-semialdehyde aminotransferase